MAEKLAQKVPRSLQWCCGRVAVRNKSLESVAGAGSRSPATARMSRHEYAQFLTACAQLVRINCAKPEEKNSGMKRHQGGLEHMSVILVGKGLVPMP